MVYRKYADDDAIRLKITQLFEYRKLDDLIRLGELSENKEWIGHLIAIQTQIYHLDAYLENTWELDTSERRKYWDAIRSSLRALGYDGKQTKKLLAEIKIYERIEKDCRLDRWPTRVPFKTFYTTKSCDVRLMRHLIYDAAPALGGIWKEETWKYYDLITEINDDICDVWEDMETYNGNRFLISLLRKGIPVTLAKYKSYIDRVTKRANRFFKKHPKQELDLQLHDWIISRSAETLDLLEITRQKLDIDLLSRARVLEHMH